jgi:hypothetical protein
MWIVGGGRSGKDSVASLLATHTSAMFDGTDLLRPGLRAAVMCLTTDRDQAKIVLNYSRAMFAGIDLFKSMVSGLSGRGQLRGT